MSTLAAEQLSTEPSSVRAARRAVCGAVEGLIDGEQLERLLLCTSEIVTNAVEHGAPPVVMVVARTDGRVRVEVADGSPLRPRLGDPPPEEVRGRGLLLVDRCSDAWGVEMLGLTGKVVWFEVEMRGARQAGKDSTSR